MHCHGLPDVSLPTLLASRFTSQYSKPALLLMTHIKACGEGYNPLFCAGEDLGIMAPLHTEVGVNLSCFLGILNCDDIM